MNFRQFTAMLSLAFLLCISGFQPMRAQQVALASGGDLRVLDKLTGEVSDVSLQTLEQVVVGFLRIRLNDCRINVGGRESTAFSSLTIWSATEVSPLFNGWMIDTSPALNGLDHPRYDVWLLGCNTS